MRTMATTGPYDPVPGFISCKGDEIERNEERKLIRLPVVFFDELLKNA